MHTTYSGSYDSIIIGGGVIGAFLLRELSRYDLSVLLLEKESKLAQHATTHNSALIHPAIMIDPQKGPLKCALAEKGNRMYEQLKAELDIPLRATGGLLLAKDETEVDQLRQKIESARDRGLEDEVGLLDYDEVHQREPNLQPGILAALNMPTTKTSTMEEVSEKITGNALAHGAEIHRGKQVRTIQPESGGSSFTLTTSDGSRYGCNFLMNAAGAFAEQVARMVEEHPRYRITPRRGEYLVLSESAGDFVRHALYPPPTSQGKGVLVIPQPNGTIRLGPTSTPQQSPESTPVTENGLAEIRAALAKIARNIPYDKVIDTYAGVRASCDYRDFFLKNSSEYPNFIHVAGIDSPGVTSAPALAEYVVNSLFQPLGHFTRKDSFDASRGSQFENAQILI